MQIHAEQTLFFMLWVCSWYEMSSRKRLLFAASINLSNSAISLAISEPETTNPLRASEFCVRSSAPLWPITTSFCLCAEMITVNEKALRVFQTVMNSSPTAG